MQSIKNIVQLVESTGACSILLNAARTANLADLLQKPGPFTVFAPTDEAFAKLPPPTLERLLADAPSLESVLAHHIVPTRLLSVDIIGHNGARPTTISGGRLEVEVRDDILYVDGARVTRADIAASNGVVHLIDAVVLPHSLHDVVS